MGDAQGILLNLRFKTVLFCIQNAKYLDSFEHINQCFKLQVLYILNIDNTFTNYILIEKPDKVAQACDLSTREAAAEGLS